MEKLTVNRVPNPTRVMLLPLVIIVTGLCIYSYHSTFLWLYERFNNPDSHYSHGYLIPFITGWLIWQRREHLKQIPRSSNSFGLVLIVVALLVHIASVWVHTFFSSGFSLLALVVGMSLYLFGTGVTRAIGFPLAFLAFMFPLPMRVISAFSFPLKMLVAKLGVKAIELAGLPIVREGAVIHLENATLTVGDPCSGIRSLIALLAMGALIAFLAQDLTALRKVTLFLVAIPIAILTNVLRVCALILAANFLGAEWASPEHWFHTASGMGVFVVSMALIFLFMKVLEWKRPKGS